MSKFLSQKENLASLISKMSPDEAMEYSKFGHLRIESAFEDRVFIVYQPRGPRAGRTLTEQREPKVLTTVRVKSLTTDIRNGAQVRLFDEASGTEMTVGYVPKKLFGYPIFVSIPAEMNLKLGGQLREDETVSHSFTFTFLIKSRNESSFYSTDNTYMETPVNFKRLFPNITEQFSF